MTYIRSDLPPVLTIHGDADTIVPYAHATQLHNALKAKGVTEQLHTIPGGGHGGFTLQENVEAMNTIQAFLRSNDII